MVQARRPGRRDSHLAETATSETYRRACRHVTDETRMASERLGRIGFELGGAFAGGMKLQDPAACRGADLAAPFLGNVAQESDHVLGGAGNQDLVVRHEIGRASCRERVCQYV